MWFIFLFSFIFIYGSFQVYFYYSLNRAYHLAGLSKAGVIIFLLFMLFGIMITRFIKTYNPMIAAYFSYITYSWMPISLMFLFYGGLTDFLNIFYKLSNQKRFLIPLIITIVLFVYGHFEARNIKINQVEITSSKIPAGKEYRIAQITDVHYDLLHVFFNEKKMFELIDEINPDILVSTGDLVDGLWFGVEKTTERFSQRNKYKKFAVTGNHEFFFDFEYTIEKTEKFGFEILRQKTVNIDEYLSVSGVDDITIKRFSPEKNTYSSEPLVADLDKNKFNILLNHQPLFGETEINNFDLQLSGHTHKGQFFPFGLITGMVFKVNSGLKTFGNFNVFVSRGTGTWGPPVRVFSRPEVTLLLIKAKAGSDPYN
ncbi:MAG: metallophosphoesterase [Candidatus Muiribacteriota bacterium]